jgi:hypothetical protein
VLNDPARQAAAHAAVDHWIASPESYGAITLFVVGGRRA